MATRNGTSNRDTLIGTNRFDSLFGFEDDDLLSGRAGDDLLDGGSGADRMVGGLGNDVFIVDDSGDAVVESFGQGRDTVRASIDYVLGANVENLVLTGDANLSGTGNSLANRITGNAGNNALSGEAGNDRISGGGGDDDIDGGAGRDVLIGGAGNDRLENGEVMIGGPGDDKYFVDAKTDSVIEGANRGTDTVETFVSYTLPVNVEVLLLNNFGIVGVGNAGDNTIIDLTFGPSGNTLRGGGGDDLLIGGIDGNARLFGNGGNDTLLYGPALTRINGGGGFDTLRLQSDVILDLTAIADTRITGIERIDMVNGGPNHITLAMTDVLALSSTTDVLRIDGDDVDHVSAGPGWTALADTNVGGMNYHQYAFGNATLLIGTEITTEFV